MSPYLDASALVPVIMKEPSRAAVVGFLATAVGRPMISDFAAAEVSSAVSRLVRVGELSAEQARDRLFSFDTWCATDFEAIDVAPQDVRTAASFVRMFELKLRTPDALHLATCLRLGAVMVCLDRRLAAAAEALDVPVQLLG